MKQLLNCLVFLALLAFAIVPAMAQSANLAVNNTETTAKNNPGYHNNAAAINEDDATPVITIIDAFPNPNTGMLSIKTPCAGKIYFYSLKGREKGGCIVNEGINPVYLQNVLNPGTYICRFEGVDGTAAEVRVTYKP